MSRRPKKDISGQTKRTERRGTKFWWTSDDYTDEAGQSGREKARKLVALEVVLERNM